MHEVRRAGSDRLRSRRWSRLHLLLIGVVSVSLLAACGGGDDNPSIEDRRFATDPRKPTSTATLSVPSPTPDATATGEPSTDVTVVASPTPAIVSTVTTVYAIADDAVIAVDTASNATRVLARSSAERDIARISSAADGEQVAILYSIASGTETRYDLEVRSKTGQELAAWRDIESGLD
ncbi:MAG: hypothetical protein ACRDHN_16220, partial [Thermomicrobiales bacterium]